MEMIKETAYTSLAAREPRIEALNALPKVQFPFAKSAIEFQQNDDRLIQVRIPVDAGESIYGFGLQLDGIKKSKKVLDLNVDHWGDPIDKSRDAYGHPLEIRHYGKQPGSFELYEDDGRTFNHENGTFALRRFDFTRGNGSESVTKPGEKLFGSVEKWVEMTR